MRRYATHGEACLREARTLVGLGPLSAQVHGSPRRDPGGWQGGLRHGLYLKETGPVAAWRQGPSSSPFDPTHQVGQDPHSPYEQTVANKLKADISPSC